MPYDDEIPPYDYAPIPESLNHLSRVVFEAALEVHRALGPGHKEEAYEEALAIELRLRGIDFQQQVWFDVVYKGQVVSRSRLDFLVGNELVVEVKSCDSLVARDRAQVLGYLRCTGKRLALLINFNTVLLREATMRVIL
jgi:GxxExxY protein